jgi:hypothetical protein
MRAKADLYATEQRELSDKVVVILGLDENSSVWLGDLDQDTDRQRQLLELIPDIRTYFSYTLIPGANTPGKLARPWLSIAKAVTKDHYTWCSKDQQKDHKRLPRYYLQKK